MKPSAPSPLLRAALAAALFAVAGCEQLGLPDPAHEATQAEAEGRAIGSACRHAGRAIEDCYTLNQGARKAAVFAGWREMNDYMLENKIAEVPPQLPPPEKPAPKAKAKAAEAKAAEAEEQAKATEAAEADEAATDGGTARRRRRASDGHG